MRLLSSVRTLQAAKASIAQEDLQFRSVSGVFTCPCGYALMRGQGTGGLLVSKVDGDYANVVGFPSSSFVALLETLVDEDDDFLSI
jgi:predicted house-cleaning NTP pyrophosphatase (Maf/HAM1 superfamily)